MISLDLQPGGSISVVTVAKGTTLECLVSSQVSALGRDVSLEIQFSIFLVNFNESFTHIAPHVVNIDNLNLFCYIHTKFISIHNMKQWGVYVCNWGTV